MVVSNLTILDQIARFFILLSDAPLYWFTINTSCYHAFHLLTWLGMDKSDYKALLIAGNLAGYKGGTFIIQANEWILFLFGHHLFMHLPSDRRAFQFDRKRIALDGKRQNLNIIQIGWISDMSPRNFESQNKLDPFPSQINSLRLQQQNIRQDTELAIANVHIDLFVGAEEDSLSESASSKSLAPRMGLPEADVATKIVGDEIGIRDVGRQMYPILAGVYGNKFDPVDHKTLKSIRLMLLEIVHLLDASQEGLKVKDFGGHNVVFIRVPCSSSDKSFNNTKSWVDEALKINGLTHGGTFESAFHVSNHLCRFYRDSFVAAMNKQGMAIAQPMLTVQFAAMMSRLNITGTKERVLVKFMRQHLGAGFCPTQRSVWILAEGHTKVQTGSMPWIYDGKEKEETVEWTKKDLHTEIEVQMLRCLKSRGVRPSDVKAVNAVVGGNHGDTAFQFGDAISAEMQNGEQIYLKVTTVK
jgi:hypothetical protein